MFMEENGLKLINEKQIPEYVNAGYDYARISFPNTEIDPIYFVFEEFPPQNKIQSYINSHYGNIVENYVITGRRDNDDSDDNVII